MEEAKKFTLQELNAFNGKNGKPQYVGYKGKVYDVSDSSLCIDGDHLGHDAGQDLSEAMEIAPHDDSVMERAKVVGVLVQQ